MKCNDLKIRDRNAARGFTLPETLVGVAVGSLALMSIMLIFMSSNRSFVAMGNYVSLDQTSGWRSSR